MVGKQFYLPFSDLLLAKVHIENYVLRILNKIREFYKVVTKDSVK